MNQKLLRARKRFPPLRLLYLGFHRANQLILRDLQIEVVPLERLHGDLHGARGEARSDRARSVDQEVEELTTTTNLSPDAILAPGCVQP
jgi:hypothetical protein